MKFAETKIYLKFIAWFLLVAITPLIILLVIFFKFYPGSTEFGMPLVANSTILISLFSALAAVLVLAILATRHLSQLVSRPVRSSIEQLLKVVKAINKSIDNLAIITKDNHQITKFLSSTAQTQQKGLRTGNVAVKEIVQSLSAIAQKVSITTQNTKSIDKLADDSEDKAQAALSSLVAVKHLSAENQKLTQALDNYAHQVGQIAQRVELMADSAKYLSLNATIEANKTAISEEFNSLVNQISQLNIVSEEAATSIKDLTGDMQRQIKQTKKTSLYELQETEKSIGVIGQTIKFLTKITKGIRQVSQDIKVIDAEATETQQAADEVVIMVTDLNKEAQTLVKEANNISQVVNKQMAISRTLSRSFDALKQVASILNNLVGRL